MTTTPDLSAPISPLGSEFPQSRRHSSACLSVASGLTDRSSTFDDDFRYQTMVTYLANRISSMGWAPLPAVASQDPSQCFGVLLKKARGQYSYTPSNVHQNLLAAVQRLNVSVAFTMRPEMLEGILTSLPADQTDLRLNDGSQVQILSSLNSVSGSAVKKYQYACLLRHEKLILVWHDGLQQIVPQALRLEEKLLGLVWGSGNLPLGVLPHSSRPTSIMTATDHHSAYRAPVTEKNSEAPSPNDSQVDLEVGESKDAAESLDRPVILNSAVFVGLGLALGMFLVFGVAASQLFSESLLDGSWTRLALLAASPLLLLSGLFFFQVIVGDIFQLVGPIACYNTNSRFYSPKRPSLRQAYRMGFSAPHITIQMPVYKESLERVIKPTVQSLQAAISYYESRGGTASIFVNDDGMRVISEEDATIRKAFYYDNNIGWVARPKDKTDGFIRKGKFKKASNMNFALNISNKVEAYLQQMVEDRGYGENQGMYMIDGDEEQSLYDAALERVLEENPLAHAAGNIRMGEIILIVDSDTRVPEDCLLYGAAEMFLSPEVAIVQHNTGVMQVSWDYFENGITFFTNMIYTAICFAIGSGEVAPFVGHNAFLRWNAVQAVGREEEGGYVAFWSESHVSEDFDIALRLQIAGSIVRVASYHGAGFQEGVSLTIYDEIARWQKYAYGCSEMIFHPLYQWPFKGPFSPLIGQFLGSNIQFSSKIGIFAYICSYFAIGCGLPLTILNYILVGWFPDFLDHFYLPSWKVFVSLVLVFNIAGNVSLAVLRYRTSQRTFLGSLLENYKWMPMMAVFFSGISFHVSAALLAHLLHIDMTWGATSKEKEDSNFFQEIPRILKTFKYMYAMCVLLVGAMIYLAFWAPRGWNINDFTAIVPLAILIGGHVLAPLALNPSLMVFSY